MSRERLDKIIAAQSAVSRRDVHRAVRDGSVSVNGVVVKDPSILLCSDKDEIAFMGKRLIVKEYVYVMLNKPRGILSAANDKKAQTVIDLLPDELRHRNLFPAGRLDKDTTGFILITDDGEFAHRILAPKSHVSKTYEALLERAVTAKDIDAFSAGITLADGTELMPAALKALDGERAEIIINEGKYHQIKRMFAATGNGVLELKRTAIGALTLDSSLSEGESKLLMDDEVLLIG